MPQAKYNKWVRENYSELRQIVLHDYIFRQTAFIIDSNNDLLKENHFFNWMKRAYVSDIVVRIRRITDSTKGTKSFRKLLEELKNNSELLAEKKYLELYQGNQQDVARADYKRLTNGTLPKVHVDRDIKMVESIVKKIKSYADKVIVHSGDVSTISSQIPTFDEIPKTIDQLCEIVKKYYQWITGDGIDFEMRFSENWQSVFERPWKRQN